MGKQDTVAYKVNRKKEIEAPVKKGQVLGEVIFYLNGEEFRSYPITAEKDVERLTLRWCVDRVFHDYFH